MPATAVEEIFRALSSVFRGELLRPHDARFEDAARIWNSAAQKRPGLIARCADVSEVQTAIRLASASGVLTAIRCGGHSLAGYSSCDGGLVLDLSGLRDVAVDESGRRAKFSGGCLLRTVDSATQEAGLAFPAGVVSHTGASGLVLGGGTGWLTRAFGLSCDNVEACQVVLADGSLVRASASENAELFWALRGGGGNFGVVTEFEVRLHPVKSIVLTEAMWGEDQIVPLIDEWQQFMLAAPEELKWNLSLKLAPDSEDVPPGVRGRPVISVAMIWVSDPAAGMRYMRHIARITPLASTTREISFLQLQTIADHEFPHGRRYYTKSGYFHQLSREAVEAMIAALPDVPSTRTQIELAYLGGAAARVGAAETAFGDRSAPVILNILADWDHPEDDARSKAWVRGLFDALRPSMKPGVYVNFMSGDEEDRTTEVYQERWNRLTAVKAHYDPKNFFRLNQNIRPMATAGTLT